MTTTVPSIIITSNTILSFNDGYGLYIINANSNNITITLPDISQNDGYSVNLYRSDLSNINNVIVTGINGSQLINGLANISLFNQTSINLVSLGGVWYDFGYRGYTGMTGQTGQTSPI